MKTPTRITPSTMTKSSVDSTGSQLVRSAGPTLKSMSANPIAIANEKMIWPRPICVWISPSSSRSCEATFAEMASARNPIASDSPSAMTPRIDREPPDPPPLHRRADVLHDLGDVALGRADGHRPRRRAAHHHAFENGLAAVADRHAAQASRRRGGRGAGLLEAALEALHPTAGVDELLLPRVERMALGADLDVELLLRRARPELVAARARDVRQDVVGMDVGLHRLARIPAAVCAATFPPETMQTVRAGSTLPASTAATAAAPAGSQASFARS